MAFFDRTGRRLDLKVVYWGPARGGKTTSLRSLHAAFPPYDRGDVQSVETEDERTYFFDYAPLDLPRYGDLQVRVNAYTVPGQAIYAATRRRILRGCDGVIFVADATAGLEANEASWRQLDAELVAREQGGRPYPVLLALNKMDVAGSAASAEVERRLREVTPKREPAGVVETTATRGTGVVRSFRIALLASAAHALGTDPASGARTARQALLRALEAQLSVTDHGWTAESAAPRATTVVHPSEGEPDLAGLEVALEATSRWTDRDRDARRLERESALARTIAEVGRRCLAARDAEDVARSTLAAIVPGLEALGGWIGLPGPAGGDRTFDAQGPAADAWGLAPLARHAEGKGGGLRTVDVPPGGHASLPRGARAVSIAFAAEGGTGWLLVAGPAPQGLGSEVEWLLPPVAACVELALDRLAAAAALRRANGELERRVHLRSADAERERGTRAASGPTEPGSAGAA
jgi:signal recognition particle receptor subunit beta